MTIKIDDVVKIRFPELRVLTCAIREVNVKKQNDKLEEYKSDILKSVRKKYDINSLKDGHAFRAYRTFFWGLGIDPTKIRPAAEALIRRILGGKSIPCINTLVDAYNIASVKTEIALAAFDADKLEGNLILRFSKKGEKFLGIGMNEHRVLNGDEIIVSDAKKLVAIYPYRDAENTKITEKTTHVLLLACGVPGIKEETLRKSTRVAFENIFRFCGGRSSE